MEFGTFYSARKLVGGRIVSKIDRLLTLKIDRQPYNRRKFFIDRELEQLDNNLRRIDITGLQIYFDLIQPILPLYFNRCFVRSFINIFVDIFYNLNRSVNLDININIVFTDEIQVVKDNKTVIKTDLLSADDTNYKLAVIISAVDQVTVVGHLDLVCKRLQKTFHTL